MLIVDTYNVLHVTGVLPADLAGIDAPGLARLIARGRWRRRDALLVCDGDGGRGLTPQSPIILDFPGSATVRIIFAGPGRDADALIEQLINEHSAPRRLLIVSSDARIRNAARRRKCASLRSEEFLEKLAQDAARRPAPPDPAAHPARAAELQEHEVDAWLHEFGIEPPTRPAPGESAPPAPQPSPPQEKNQPPRPAPPPPKPKVDESLLREAAREWPGRVDPDDLDMDRWIEGVKREHDD